MRWFILLVLMFGFCASYFQRMTLSVLGMGAETVSLYSPFGIGMLAGTVGMAAVTAMAGTRWGLTASLTGTSLAAMAAGFVTGSPGFTLATGLLGFFIGGLVPAMVQAVREWFPPPERPLAIGLILAAGQFGFVVTSPLVMLTNSFVSAQAILALAAFPTLTAAILCAAIWGRAPAREPGWEVSPMALAWVGALAAGLFLAAPVSYFASMGPPGGAAGFYGSALFGMAAWALIELGASAWKVHVALLAVCGLMLPLVGIARFLDDGPAVIFLVALSTAGVQGWSTLLYSGVANTVPARGVAVAAAVGCLTAAVGGMLIRLVMMRLG